MFKFGAQAQRYVAWAQRDKAEAQAEWCRVQDMVQAQGGWVWREGADQAHAQRHEAEAQTEAQAEARAQAWRGEAVAQAEARGEAEAQWHTFHVSTLACTLMSRCGLDLLSVLVIHT